MSSIIRATIGTLIVCASLAMAFAIGLLALGCVAALAVNHSYWAIPALPVGFCVMMAAWALHVSIVEWTACWANGL